MAWLSVEVDVVEEREVQYFILGPDEDQDFMVFWAFDNLAGVTYFNCSDPRLVDKEARTVVKSDVEGYGRSAHLAGIDASDMVKFGESIAALETD